MAPDLGSSARHIQRRISRYVSVDVTQQTGQKTSKMWNYFFLGPLSKQEKLPFFPYYSY
jgi:hypothetical protein